MKTSILRLALLPSLLAATLPAQQPAAPVYTQTLTYVKVSPGKASEYERLLNETMAPVYQQRANAGEILSWTLLRTVLPAGQEARADYVISVISEGAPPKPLGRAEFESALKKSGVKVNAEEFFEKRRSISTLVAVEMWRPQIRVAAPQTGHYLYLNHMKVHDAAAYTDFERTIWRPMAEQWVKEGAMSGWIYATKLLPAGTDTPYSAYSSDMFPTWQAAFAARSAQAVFEKAHPGKNYQETMGNLGKLRSLARRELWVVVARVEKST